MASDESISESANDIRSTDSQSIGCSAQGTDGESIRYSIQDTDGESIRYSAYALGIVGTRRAWNYPSFRRLVDKYILTNGTPSHIVSGG